MLGNLRRFWSDFHQLCMLVTVVTGLLFLTLLLMPGLVCWLFNLDRTLAVDVMSRRAGMLFLGISVIAFQARHAVFSPLRQSISLGIAVLMTGLLVIGLYDFSRGFVGIGIFFAILVELYFASAFFRFWMQRK